MEINEIKVGRRYGNENGNGEIVVREVMARGLEPSGYRWVQYKEGDGEHQGRRIRVSCFARWARFEV